MKMIIADADRQQVLLQHNNTQTLMCYYSAIMYDTNLSSYIVSMTEIEMKSLCIKNNIQNCYMTYKCSETVSMCN